MEPSKQFEDLAWADLTIVGDELKAVQVFDIKTVKYKDLRAVRIQLKIKVVKNATKEHMIQKLFSLKDQGKI